MILATGMVEELLEEGAATVAWSAPGLFDEMVLAGYPLCADVSATFDGCIDLLTDGRSVVAQTNGEAPHEHDMTPVGDVFLSWFKAEAADV